MTTASAERIVQTLCQAVETFNRNGNGKIEPRRAVGGNTTYAELLRAIAEGHQHTVRHKKSRQAGIGA